MGNVKKKGLGQGLGALFRDTPVKLDEIKASEAGLEAQTLPDGSRLVMLDPREIKPNPKQPRQVFNEEALQELAESLKRDGMQEPVLVRHAGDHYELVGGERRVRASVMADIESIPAIVRQVDDRDMLKLSLIENVQREDLNAIELAQAYQQLVDEYHWTQEQLAAEVGKKRATVANTLRLLTLPPEVQRLVAQGDLSMGHARAILALNSPLEQCRAARKTVEQGLSVRQVEKMTSPAPPRKSAEAKDPNIASIEDELRRALGTKVSLKTQKNHRGRVEIEYFSLDDLERILAILRGRK